MQNSECPPPRGGRGLLWGELCSGFYWTVKVLSFGWELIFLFFKTHLYAIVCIKYFIYCLEIISEKKNKVKTRKHNKLKEKGCPQDPAPRGLQPWEVHEEAPQPIATMGPAGYQQPRAGVPQP